MEFTPTPRAVPIARRLAGGLVAGLAVTVAAAPGAQAAAADQWWVTGFNLAQNHTIADGTGVTVAVLDGTFSPSAPSVAGIDLVPPVANTCVGEGGATAVTADDPSANHAVAMVTTLAGKGTSGPVGAAPGAKVLVYNTGITNADSTKIVCRNPDDGLSDDDKVTGDAINDAVAKGARIISMSFAGGSEGAVTQTAILYGERKGVVFVAGTQDRAEVTGSRVQSPAVFNGVVVVNGITPAAQLIPNSATGADGPLVVATGPGADMAVGGYTAPGTWDPSVATGGSSSATAFVAGSLATTLSKYPTATGNQLIQSLARNTGGSEHDPEVRGTDGFGYGTVSLTSMLATDPTTYPDENPLLRDGADPATSEILEGSSSSPSPSSSGSSSAPTSSAATSSAASSPRASSTPVAAADSSDGTPTGLLVGLGAGVGVLIGLGVLVVFLLTRRSRRRAGLPPGPPPPPPAWG